MKNILLVEDDKTLGDVLSQELAKDYHVSWARSQRDAFQKLKSSRFDLLILDIGLPDGDGFTIAESFDGPSKPYFLFLTAQNDPETRLRGYEAGGEDFIPKPFHLKEVLLRVKHVLDTHVVPSQVDLGYCRVDLQSFSIKHKEGPISYPPVRDMMILKLLIEMAPSAVSRDQIMDRIWGGDRDLSPRTIDNAIVRLRQALGDTQEEWIRSVRGVGYQWLQPELNRSRK